MIWMTDRMNLGNEYVASVLGLPKPNSVSGRIRNLRKKNKTFYNTDGTDVSRLLDKWLNHFMILQFKPDSGDWLLIFHLPLDCSVPEKRMIRVELLKKDGSHVSSAIIRYGEITCEIEKGWGEMNLSDFHTAIRAKIGSVKVVDRNNREFEGFPVYRNESIVNVMTNGLFEKWSTRKPDDALHFIADFGLGFAWILNRDLDYEKYGAPSKFQYADLGVVPGEALILFAATPPCPGGALPEHGFILPLEWRFNPSFDEPFSRLLPPPLISLARKIADQQKVRHGWGLHPSFRFFHDQTDFSGQTIFGATDEAVASAYLSLSAALFLALRKYAVPKQLFASAQYDWRNEVLREIHHLEQKMHLASAWNPDKFFVADSQKEEAEKLVFDNEFKFTAVGCDSAGYAAFHFLDPLRPDRFSALKTIPDGNYKVHRPALLDILSALTNAAWDKRKKTADEADFWEDGDFPNDNDFPEDASSTFFGGEDSAPRQSRDSGEGFAFSGNHAAQAKCGAFVVLTGKPGMGKSILMSDLSALFRERAEHVIFTFSCDAGDRNCAENFVKSLSWQMAARSSAFAAAALKNMSNLRDGAEIEDLYRSLVYEPLILTADKNRSRHYYILVDGLDEDASGKVAALLADTTMRFPVNYAVTAACRPVEPMLSVLKARATGILDIDGREYVSICRKDLGKFITNYIYSNTDVYHSWLELGFDSENLRKKIIAKDKSFLYAVHVLQGVADGMYHFNQLDRELPAGLTAFYNQSFHYRFAAASEYEAVQPLLKLLLENDAISVEDASRQLNMPVGRLVRRLHGYCVVNGDMLSLSDTSLREWLRDSIKNPDYSIL